MSTSFEDIKTALDDHLRDQLQPVTYKWISRQFKINYDVSKRILFKYSNIGGNNIEPVFLLAGFKEDDGSRAVVKLVNQRQLESAKRELTSISSLHIYGIQPGLTQSNCNLLGLEITQAVDLFQNLLASSENQGISSQNALISNELCNVLKAQGEAGGGSNLSNENAQKHRSRLEKNLSNEKNGLNRKELNPKATEPNNNSATGFVPKTSISSVQQERNKDRKISKHEKKGPVEKKSNENSIDDIVTSIKRSPTVNKRGRIIDDSDDEIQECKAPKKLTKAHADDTQPMSNVGARHTGNVKTERDNFSINHLGGQHINQVKKVLKTFYNDAGEEVTEMIEADADGSYRKEKDNNKLEGKHTLLKKPETGKLTNNPSSKGQRSIASFFSKR